MSYQLGVDVGGTFTDCVLWGEDEGRVWSAKVLTSIELPSRAIFEGMDRLCAEAEIEPRQVTRFVHTTTLVGNAVIERRGNRTALVTTRGFRDILLLRREYRYDLFDPLLEFPEPLVPRALSFELDERLDARGNVVRALDRADVEQVAHQLREAGVQSVAVSLIHSYANDVHERVVAEVLAERLPHATVSLSTEVLPQIREYERTSATTINAYVQPVVADYLDDLERGLRERGCGAQILIVTSSGGTVSVKTAKRLPIQLVESGPAAGVVFAARLGQDRRDANLVAFDMGGTTAKVCIVRDGTPHIRNDLEVARARRFKAGSGLPVGIPLFDLLEIGAGGGSIAELDPTGLVRVGPRSAGSTPGPACYGRGGTDATVTDANLVLGLLDADAFLGGERRLDVGAAEEALATSLARPMGVSVVEAAEAVYRVVTHAMAEALRIRSVESNVDVRRYTLMAFGGGGGIHAVDIARLVGIEQVICPPRAGVFSAAGLLIAPVNVEVLRSRIVPLTDVDPRLAREVYDALEADARDAVRGLPASEYRLEYSVDMSYVGQEYEITVSLPRRPEAPEELAALTQLFEDAYRARYGRTLPGYATRVVTWRLRLVGGRPALLPLRRERAGTPQGEREIFLGGRRLTAAVHDRRALQPGDAFVGPAIVQDVETTILLPPGTRGTCDEGGTIVVDCRREAVADAA